MASQTIDDAFRNRTSENIGGKAEPEAMAGAEEDAAAWAEFEEERRFSLRFVVPPGAMIIHWTNRDGTRHQGRTINVSMRSVLFESPMFDAGSIDRVVCPRLNIDLNVTKSVTTRHEEGKTAAVLEEFEDDIDSRMAWVELLTRIDGK